MHFIAENEPLGIVEEARRRREQYKRYIDRRVAAAVARPSTQRQIEAEVAERVHRQVARLVAERAARQIEDVRRNLPSLGPPIVDILTAVARAASVSVGELVGPRHACEIAWPRHVAVLLMSELRPDLSALQIGRALGGRDDSSVLLARASATERIADSRSDEARWYAQARALLFTHDDGTRELA